MRGALLGLVITVTLAYPIAVYFGLQHAPPQALAAVLAALIGLRLLTDTGGRRGFALVGMALLVFSLFAIWRNDILTLRFYPVLTNLLMLALFGWTLIHPPSMIERLARLHEPVLPAPAIVYTRRVTGLWCLFFIANGMMALYTALFSSLAVWSLYNGLISYLLMGALFLGEWLCRLRIKGRHQS